MSTIVEIGGNNLLLPAVLGTLLLGYVAHVAWQWYRLSHIPGPFWANLSKFPMVWKCLTGREASTVKEVTEKYGSLARIGPTEIVTADPDVLRRMMAVRSEYTRGPWYSSLKLEHGKDNLLSTRDEAAHTRLRGKMAAGYSGKENESMEGTIDEQIAALVDLINTKYISAPGDYRPMDLGPKIQYFTLDVISALAFGSPFGDLKEDRDVQDYIKITRSFLPIILTLGLVPWLSSLVHSRLFRNLMPKETDKLGPGALIRFAKGIVAERFASSSKPQRDMLGSFIRHGLTQEQVASETLLQVIAGSDTSAGMIRLCLLHVLTAPSICAKLQAEIDNGISTGAISSPIKDAEGRKLPYLQAIIKEALRVYPPATGLFFRDVPPQGDVINGMFIPGGTQIGSSSMAMHRSKEIFGADAEIFRPERWLEAQADPERLARMSSTVDLVFHYGKYQCLGRNVALMEFNKVFVELLRAFDFAILRPEKPARISHSGIWVIDEFWVRVTRRGSKNATSE